MISQGPLHTVEHAVNDALLGIDEHVRLSSTREDVSDIDVPATQLPVLPSRFEPQDHVLKVAKSVVDPATRQSRSKTEQQDLLIKAWAVLLHTYAASEAVAFAVFSDSSRTNPARLAVSRTSAGSHDLPQLSYLPFDASAHQEKVNTAISFVDVDRRFKGFSYVLNLSVETPPALHLYTLQSSVPRKFASALWSSFLEITSNAKGMRPGIISKADQRAIQSFMPTPLFGRRRCLHEIFLDSARVVPHATAIQAWDGSLTYSELNVLSNKVANHLLQLGTRKQQCIPFCFEKSAWMVVATVGILKAGGSMVAIDCSQPRARAQEIIKETGAKVVVVSPAQAPNFVGIVETIATISSDIVKALDESTESETTLPYVQPEDPATVIFTSGSTGKPKGIVIDHGAFSTRLIGEGIACEYQSARTLQFCAPTWDIFVTDIFTTLAFKGCICIPNEDDRRFNLSKVCTKDDVSLALFTPTVANVLDPAAFPSLKTLIFAGEALRKEVVEKWSAVEKLSLIQAYGPAETGICIAGSVADRPEILGYALDHSVCILVDPKNHERLVPLGSVGELVVGGPAVLREYINHGDKCDAKFIKDPTWAVTLDLPVKQFYKTGDLLRYSIDALDGRFEFVGRTDNQVKYHGQRIELGEIEHHLSAMPEVEDCMVALVKKNSLKDKLVAVIQPKGSKTHSDSGETLKLQHDSSVTLLRVREFLSKRLPEYMIPNRLFAVTALPRSTSMKLDRTLVSNWLSNMQTESADELVPRQNAHNRLFVHESTARDVARQYARIVAEDDEALRRNFEEMDFNLQAGGIDSIQIISLSMTLNSNYGVQVPMADMLSSRSTVRTIASIIDSKSGLSKQLPVLGNIKRVLLTGASGFLGIEILRQLLVVSHCHVYALMRASNGGDSAERLVRKATEAGWWQEKYHSRLHIWQGDLGSERLGLSDSHWRSLQGHASPSIDAIIHNGAKVHYSLDYKSVKAANVSSTIELLKAVASRAEPLQSFVYVSGGQQLSFDGKDDEKYAAKSLNEGGYAQSKVVSERIVRAFAEQNPAKARHIRVVKPGFIIGDSIRGAANETDFIWRLIAASVDIGCYNEEEADSWIYISDIVRVSQAILRGVFEEETEPITKVLDGMKLGHLWGLLRDRFDFHLEPVSRQQWLARLRQAVAIKQTKHTMFPLMYKLEASNEPLGVPNGPSNATAGVESAIEANVTRLIALGFLPNPDMVPTPNSSEASKESLADVIDVETVRESFPALHKGIVAFNNAGGTVVHQASIDRASEYMSAFPVDSGLDDEESRKATEQRTQSFKELAAFMNASPDEIGKRLAHILKFPPPSPHERFSCMKLTMKQLLVQAPPSFYAHWAKHCDHCSIPIAKWWCRTCVMRPVPVLGFPWPKISTLPSNGGPRPRAMTHA